MGVSVDGMAITPYLHSWAYEQEDKTKKNGYVAFHKGKQTTVHALTSYEAQKLAAAYFRTKQTSSVTVVLAKKAGQDITTTLT